MCDILASAPRPASTRLTITNRVNDKERGSPGTIGAGAHPNASGSEPRPAPGRNRHKAGDQEQVQSAADHRRIKRLTRCCRSPFLLYLAITWSAGTEMKLADDTSGNKREGEGMADWRRSSTYCYGCGTWLTNFEHRDCSRGASGSQVLIDIDDFRSACSRCHNVWPLEETVTHCTCGHVQQTEYQDSVSIIQAGERIVGTDGNLVYVLTRSGTVVVGKRSFPSDGYSGGENALRPDNGGYAHYADKDEMHFALIGQKPVTALCGWTWVPQEARSLGLPTCPKCQSIYNALPS
jgi:hypothetical protein